MSNMDEKIPVFGKGMRNTGGGISKDSKSKFMGKRSRGDSGGKGTPSLPGKPQPVNPIAPIGPIKPIKPGQGIPIPPPKKP